MRAIGRFGSSVLALMAVIGAWSLAARQVSGLELRPAVVVVAPDPAQRRLAEWAVARFERAGLAPPTVEIHLHGSSSGCVGHLGYAQIGRVDVCTVLVNEMARRNLLHEIGHIWIDQNVSRTERVRFLDLRGQPADLERVDGRLGVSRLRAGSRDHLVGPGKQDPDRPDPRQRGSSARRRVRAPHRHRATGTQQMIESFTRRRARRRRAPPGCRRGCRGLRRRTASSPSRTGPPRSRAA